MLAKLRHLTALTATLAIAASCTTDHDRLLARAYADAGSNEAQIRSMVESYEGSDRHMAELMAIAMIGQGTLTGPGMDSIEAIYTIAAGNRDLTPEEAEAGRKFAAMPMQRTSDLTTLTADWLRGHIDDTRRLRASRKWNAALTDEQAAELLMPYRMGNEPVSEWRGPYRQWLAAQMDSEPPPGGAAAARSPDRLLPRGLRPHSLRHARHGHTGQRGHDAGIARQRRLAPMECGV